MPSGKKSRKPPPRPSRRGQVGTRVAKRKPDVQALILVAEWEGVRMFADGCRTKWRRYLVGTHYYLIEIFPDGGWEVWAPLTDSVEVSKMLALIVPA